MLLNKMTGERESVRAREGERKERRTAHVLSLSFVLSLQRWTAAPLCLLLFLEAAET